MKHAHFGVHRPPPLQAVMLTIMAAWGAAAFGAPLSFDDAFGTRGEPATLHYQASYLERGTRHRLRVWRDADRRLKRSTDEVLETYVFKPNRTPEFQMVVLDKKRMIRTDIQRTHLIRIGNFTDWFDLAHGLKHPIGAHHIQALAEHSSSEKPLKPCQWYGLTQGNSSTQVCWSSTYKLPMLIENANQQVIWKVDAISTAPIQPEVFQINDVGYVKNNADTDIERD